jgi:hypothetical protein
MKKIYFLVAFLFVFNVLNVQIVTIPDARIKSKLLAASSSTTIVKDLAGNYFKIDSNANGKIDSEEALRVNKIVCCRNRDADLTGIKSFINLWFLDCSIKLIAALDITGLIHLQNLNCFFDWIPTLDVSSLVNLQTLSTLKSFYCALIYSKDDYFGWEGADFRNNSV